MLEGKTVASIIFQFHSPMYWALCNTVLHKLYYTNCKHGVCPFITSIHVSRCLNHITSYTPGRYIRVLRQKPEYYKYGKNCFA